MNFKQFQLFTTTREERTMHIKVPDFLKGEAESISNKSGKKKEKRVKPVLVIKVSSLFFLVTFILESTGCCGYPFGEV